LKRGKGACYSEHSVLTLLKIADFAIIDELALEFGLGLNVMTGETGVGKTIIVEALKLVLGARASSELVRAGAARATLTAVFDSSDMPEQARGLLEDAGVECEDELVMLRSVSAEGKGRISINGTPVSAGTLRTVAEHLVDISSQHEHQLLLEEVRYPLILDEFAGLTELRRRYLDEHAHWSRLAGELASVEQAGKNAAERMEFIRFQLDELERADVSPGELERIESELARLKHSVLLEERTRSASDLLSEGQSSVASQLAQAKAALAQCAQFEPAASGWIEAVERARIEAEEAARDLALYADGVGSDPERATELEERLHLVKGLVRKHGGSVEALLERRDEMARELETIQNHDETIERLQAELGDAAGRRRAAAGELTAARRAAAKDLGGRVEGELRDLGMGKTQFGVKVSARDEAAWDESGPDLVEFLISPNVGEPMKGLAKIASGGELSRFMLALKSVLADCAQSFGTSVFDEVDSGIGGAIASVVGRKLAELASKRQVICITHLAQVASFADLHVRIAKGVKGGRTVTSMESLDESAKVEEIARMLGGERMTEATLAHAREMLEQSRR